VKGYNPLSKFHFYNLRPLNIIFVAAFLLSFAYSVRLVYSAQVTLEWQASSGPNVAGYNLYQGTSSRDYDESMDVGNWTSVTIADLEDSETYYFAVTAYNSDGDESAYSNEACLNCATVGTTTTQGTTSSSGGGGG
jgi:fibronectin type 3 domain-containing protein